MYNENRPKTWHGIPNPERKTINMLKNEILKTEYSKDVDLNSADGYVNTDGLENTLIHTINEKKDSEKGPLSYIDSVPFVKNFMDNYEMYFNILRNL